jgi:hypothetical protein
MNEINCTNCEKFKEVVGAHIACQREDHTAMILIDNINEISLQPLFCLDDK